MSKRATLREKHSSNRELNSQLKLALLRIPDDSRTPEESFLEYCGLPEEKAKRELREAFRLGLVQVRDGCLQVSQVERLNLVVRCLHDGLDLERVCEAAGWREFEDLVAMFLESDGYLTKKHLRFRSNEKGYEIDVLALKNPWSLVVECKRWKRSWQYSALRKVADTHKRKTLALIKAFPNIGKKLGRNINYDIKLVPVVIMLSETPMKIKDGLPFVPISKFQSFLTEYAGYVEDLIVISVKY